MGNIWYPTEVYIDSGAAHTVLHADIAEGIGFPYSTGDRIYDYRKANNVAGKISDLLKLNSNNVKVASVAGQEKTFPLSCQANTDLLVNLSSPLKEVKINPNQLRKGKYNLEILLSSDISGNYTTDKIEVEVFGPYQLTYRA